METLSISEHVKRARVAQKELATFDQARIDDIVCAVARVGYVNAEPLAKLAFEETGLGRYEDKVQKNRRKTLGTLRDLTGAQSMGVIHRDDDKGITEIAKPVGVVGAITPVTNPSATPINTHHGHPEGSQCRSHRTPSEGGSDVRGAHPPRASRAGTARRSQRCRAAREPAVGRQRSEQSSFAGAHARSGHRPRHRRPRERGRGIPERNTGPRRRPGQRIGDHR